MKRNLMIGLITTTAIYVSFIGSSASADAQATRPNVGSPSNVNASSEQANTAFTFQGQLKKNGGPFNGLCSFRFTLFDTVIGGTPIGASTTVDAEVASGLFTAQLNFGNQFTGDARWLESAVKCADDGDFIIQSPRMNLAATPYAIGLVPNVVVRNSDNGTAIQGASTTGRGLWGSSDSGQGVQGTSTSQAGVVGVSSSFAGVWAESNTGVGLYSFSQKSDGLKGEAKTNGTGVWGISSTGRGVWGKSTTGQAVFGESRDQVGVIGVSTNFVGIWAETSNVNQTALFAKNTAGGNAAYFEGKASTTVMEIRGGADLAEKFDTSAPVEPGTLLVIDPTNPGKLMPSSHAYDTLVAGVVSGANGVQPGLTLHQEGVLEGNTAVAIAGRVYVKVTASNGVIRPGDLLTASDLPGYAMKATDRDRVFGTVVGKALTGLDHGTGLVLVMVNLQ